MVFRPAPIADRLAAKSRDDADTGCRVWIGYLQADGYGQIRHDGETLAHRVAWCVERGPIPPGMVIDDLCRNRACINTAHMEVVTDRVNILRGEGPSAANAVKTACARGHPFDDANTYWFRGARHCRACNRAAVARLASKSGRVGDGGSR